MVTTMEKNRHIKRDPRITTGLWVTGATLFAAATALIGWSTLSFGSNTSANNNRNNLVDEKAINKHLGRPHLPSKKPQHHLCIVASVVGIVDKNNDDVDDDLVKDVQNYTQWANYEEVRDEQRADWILSFWVAFATSTTNNNDIDKNNKHHHKNNNKGWNPLYIPQHLLQPYSRLETKFLFLKYHLFHPEILSLMHRQQQQKTKCHVVLYQQTPDIPPFHPNWLLDQAQFFFDKNNHKNSNPIALIPHSEYSTVFLYASYVKHYGLDFYERVQATENFLESRRQTTPVSTLYWKDYIFAVPSNPQFQAACEYFWKLYTTHEQEWTADDTFLWAYTLTKLDVPVQHWPTPHSLPPADQVPAWLSSPPTPLSADLLSISNHKLSSSSDRAGHSKRRKPHVPKGVVAVAAVASPLVEPLSDEEIRWLNKRRWQQGQQYGPTQNDKDPKQLDRNNLAQEDIRLIRRRRFQQKKRMQQERNESR